MRVMHLCVGWLSSGLFGLLLVGGLVTPAQAVNCGDVLPRGLVTLTSNVGPCPGTAPAITVKSLTTLNMNHFTVSCDGTSGSSGIVVQGSHILVENGTVTGCDFAFLSQPGSDHILFNGNTGNTATSNNLGNIGFLIGDGGTHVTLTFNQATNNLTGFSLGIGTQIKVVHNSANSNAQGFLVEADSAQLSHNLANGNSGDGFTILSNHVTLLGNVAVRNTLGFGIQGESNTLSENKAGDPTDQTTGNGVGFRISGNNNTNVSGNTAVFSTADGFLIDGGSNTLTGNTAQSNNGNGFVVNGNNNTLASNQAISNVSDEGFNIFGGTNILTANTATDNSDGFDIHGRGNSLTGNHATGNLIDGIVAESEALGNTITGNTATGNNAANVGGFDLHDFSDACVNNTWSGNHFGTKAPTCIQ